MSHCRRFVEATTAVRGGVLLILLLAVGTPAHAQIELVTVSLPNIVTFDVVVSSATAGVPTPAAIQFSNAIIVPGRVLRISVMADTTSFSGPGGTAIPASAVSWSVSNASGGVASGGTLSAGWYTQIFQSFVLPSTGGFDVTWTLTAPPGGVRAGTHTVSLRWKIESVLP